MRIGFGKSDITPRVGVELCGFGPYLNRHSIAVRDRLSARAMAIEQGETVALLISNDLVGVTDAITGRVRQLVADATGLPGAAVMVHCTHTHSGPTTISVTGWGAPDAPYIETLPQRIAAAAIEATENLQEATLHHAEVPCGGIGLNREYDADAPPLEEVLRDDWRPAKPELTDTACHVITARADGQLLGFASYFGCHPVVCCQETRYVHGDYAGVACSLLEREEPGSVAMFLQGAQGDVNSCVVHKPEPESLLALDVIAARFARAVRHGIREVRPLEGDQLRVASRHVRFTRKDLTIDDLRERLAAEERVLNDAKATDASPEVRMAIVHATACRQFIASMEAGEAMDRPTELQAIGIGPLSLLGTPFEVFQAIKNEVREATRPSIALVMGLTNDSLGYAPDHTAAARGGYAADTVPLMLGQLPFHQIHEELVRELTDLERSLH